MKCNCLCHFKRKPTSEEYSMSSYYGCKHCILKNINIKKIEGTGTCIAELQSAVNKLVDSVNTLQDEVAEIKSEVGVRVGGGH